MFQYALYRALKETNPSLKVKLDISHYDVAHKSEVDVSHNGYELARIFKCNAEYSSEDDLKMDSEETYWDRVPVQFDANVFSLKRGFLIGYWQCENYFKAISDKIKSDFTFREILDKRNEELTEMLSSTESVSIHVRRTDFLSSPLHNTIHPDFYSRSIRHFTRGFRRSRFVIFADDMLWARRNLNLPDNAVFVDWNKRKRSMERHATDEHMQEQYYC